MLSLYLVEAWIAQIQQLHFSRGLRSADMRLTLGAAASSDPENRDPTSVNPVVISDVPKPERENDSKCDLHSLHVLLLL